MCLLRLFKGKKTEKKPSLIKVLLSDPDQFNYNINVEGDEIVVRIKMKDSE